ncbi:hypothetical protein B0T24DRAFT_679945 [Lasiosphaeria ovina]|uniref:Uncharacterized protein n=1 Tax=Lasiosphaeria ovina TaxID=92902 RepID=A0AAE0K636_9PEZI|nr:hypothetical protein B0T24DRAFT_679945 [Lasiosphaeria ovina]
MHLFKFPAEIRLLIYSDVLVQNDPLVFGANSRDGKPPHVVWVGKRGLSPALPCVSKAVNGEAAPVLYSQSRFQFPDVWSSQLEPILYSLGYIGEFIEQIGANASLLRYITINFPSRDEFNYTVRGKATLEEEPLKALELIKESCPGVVNMARYYHYEPIQVIALTTNFEAPVTMSDAFRRGRSNSIASKKPSWGQTGAALPPSK